MTSAATTVLIVSTFFGLVFYMLPAFIASRRNVEHNTAIGLVNIFFGWTVLGWIAALIWAVVEKSRVEPRSAFDEVPERVTLESNGTVKRVVENGVLVIIAGLMRLMKIITGS